MLDQSNEVVEQPKQDSTNQDQGNEQVETTTAAEIEAQPTPEEIAEWKKGYMRQDDYTRKTQELAAERTKIARSTEELKPKREADPELEAATKVLKEAGFMTKDDVLLMKAQEEDAKSLRKLIKANPELKAQEEAIKRVGLTDNSAWSDIVTKYGFLKSDKLAKAKASQPVAGIKSVPIKEKAGKSVKDMNATEYAAWKEQNLGKDRFRKLNN